MHSLTTRGFRATLAGVMLCTVATSIVAQQPAPLDQEAFRKAQAEFNKVPNTAGDGPYPAVIETDSTLPDHVIYRPADLSPFAGHKLPILIWGNGACVDDGTAHRLHLAEIASYGYLVVAVSQWRSGPGATAPATSQAASPSGALPPPATKAKDVLAGLDWAIGEDQRKSSKYFGKIAPKDVAVAGHSCGGLQAIEIAADPRIKAVIVNNSGVFKGGKSPIPGISADKSLLDKFHTPVIYILGGPTDIAYENGTDDFARLKGPAVMLNLPVGHGGTFSEPMGGSVARVSVDWLEWQLNGDKTAAGTFVGANCRLCSGTKWSIERKGM